MQEQQLPTRGNPYSRLERPVRVGNRTVVVPAGAEYLSTAGEHVIQMEAGSAFGSGTHPTTGLCIQLIEQYLREGDSVLDVGTGSGILMIASAKLGANKLYGIDRDSNALEIAHQNLLLNGIKEDRFNLKHGNLVEGVPGCFDLIVANILTEIVFRLLDDIKGVLKETGFFICSGMIENNTYRIVSKMKRMGFKMVKQRTDRSWVAMAAMQTTRPRTPI